MIPLHERSLEDQLQMARNEADALRGAVEKQTTTFVQAIDALIACATDAGLNWRDYWPPPEDRE